MISSCQVHDIEPLRQNKKYRLLDVRQPEETVHGIIHDALCIPLSILENHHTQLTKSLTYIVYCKAGVRSMKACQWLQHQGYDVINLKGGIDQWYTHQTCQGVCDDSRR